MRHSATLAIMAVAMAASLPARAAVATFEAQGDLYTLDTGHLSGECHVIDRGGAGVDVDCEDDAGRRAFGNSKTGCLLTAKGGTCYVGKPNKLRSSIMLICGRTKFAIGTENNATTCQVEYDDSGRARDAVCDDRAGSQAKVDCSKDKGEGSCLYTSGSGGCLVP